MFRDYTQSQEMDHFQPNTGSFQCFTFQKLHGQNLVGVFVKVPVKKVQIRYLALPVAVIHKLLTAALKMHSVWSKQQQLQLSTPSNTKTKGHTKAQRFQRMADRVTQRDRTLTSLPLLSPLLLLLLLFCLFYSFPSCTLFLTPHHSPEHSVQIHLHSPRRPLGTGVHSPRCPILCVFVRVQYACVCGFFVCTCVPLTPSHWHWLFPFFVLSQVVRPSQRQRCNISHKFITSVICLPSWGVAMYKVWLNMAILIAGVHCTEYHISTAEYIKYFSMLTNMILEFP